MLQHRQSRGGPSSSTINECARQVNLRPVAPCMEAMALFYSNDKVEDTGQSFPFKVDYTELSDVRVLTAYYNV